MTRRSGDVHLKYHRREWAYGTVKRAVHLGQNAVIHSLGLQLTRIVGVSDPTNPQYGIDDHPHNAGVLFLRGTIYARNQSFFEIGFINSKPVTTVFVAS